MTGKLMFGKGTQVSIITGKSSQEGLPFATPGAIVTNLNSGGYHLLL